MKEKLFEIFPEPIPTFDLILPAVRNWLRDHSGSLSNFLSNDADWLLINRDLNGRVRLILPERFRESEQHLLLNKLAALLMQRLGKHAYPENAEILFEVNREQALQGATSSLIDGSTNVWLVDRLATEANWTRITPETVGNQRVVFFFHQRRCWPIHGSCCSRMAFSTGRQASACTRPGFGVPWFVFGVIATGAPAQVWHH